MTDLRSSPRARAPQTHPMGFAAPWPWPAWPLGTWQWAETTTPSFRDLALWRPTHVLVPTQVGGEVGSGLAMRVGDVEIELTRCAPLSSGSIDVWEVAANAPWLEESERASLLLRRVSDAWTESHIPVTLLGKGIER